MTTLEILKAARALLAKPGGWTKGAFARDKHGNDIGDGGYRGAVCFCALGAIEKVAGWTAGRVTAKHALHEALPSGETGIGHFNDTRRSVAPVLKMYDRAIARLEKGSE